MKTNCFAPADILLPDAEKIDAARWAVIACDQFTSEPEYWDEVKRIVGDAPSTLRLTLPEVYLAQRGEYIPNIRRAMADYLEKGLFRRFDDSMIYVERKQSDGRIRRGIVGQIDLDGYEYERGATTPVRATEGTVLERIPPRVEIRRGAPLELPHIMLLIDDEDKTVIEPCEGEKSGFSSVYDFDLMQGGGHLSGWLMDAAAQERVIKALDALGDMSVMKEKYGAGCASPLLFAVGDGNHSLATAKATYREACEKYGRENVDPALRYALVEVVNLHDPALDFEPIYRVVFGVEPDELLAELSAYADALHGEEQEQKTVWVAGKECGDVIFRHPSAQLTVGTLQNFLDDYAKTHSGVTVDYIHGEDSLRALASREKTVGFLFDGMAKNQLFRTVIYDGALPRKTFSMGHARDKRYYMEAKVI